MNDLTREELDGLPSHPTALDLSRAMHVSPTEVYDAFASVGQHVGNVPRRTAVALVREFVLGEC